ncbi:MAG: PDZ domain-containing protein [Dethiobacteria bacterium]|jgi:hypothetical protein|nr:PDZ domain-containing protein [Bacillota bacterium]
MEQLLTLVWMVLQTLPLFLVHPLFWLVVLLVFFQYRRVIEIEKQLFGTAKNNIWEQTALSMLTGLGGGLFASILLLLFGLSLDRIAISWLWPIALLLLMIHPRLLCFSYAGGIIGLLSLIMRLAAPYFPQLETSFLKGLLDISLPGLLFLIAVLHLTEALLIFFSGHWGNSPIFIKTPQGEVVAGFSLQRFWPLPIMGLVAIIVPEASEMLQGSVPMPEWWPLFQSTLEPGSAEKLLYLMFPVVAGLGYGDLAVSSKPRDKCLYTARNLAIYSIILLMLSLLSEFYPLFVLPGVLFAPLAHEYVVYLGNKGELSSKPYYSFPDQGVRVLDVFPGTPADKAGLKSNDLILRVQGAHIDSAAGFWTLLREYFIYFHSLYLEVLRDERILILTLPKQSLLRFRQEVFGLILVPEPYSKKYVEMKKSLFPQILKRLFKGLRKP